MNTQEQLDQGVSLRERLGALRERAADFLSNMAERILIGPAEKVIDWTEGKPDYIKAAMAYVGVPLLVAAEVATVTLSAINVGPGLAIPLGVAATYTWIQAVAIGGELNHQIRY